MAKVEAEGKGASLKAGRLPYHRRNHHDALRGMRALTNEQCGAYNRIIDLIYDNGGANPYNAVWASGIMRCSTRRYRVLRDELAALGKLEIRDGFLHNDRCEKEIEHLSKYSRSQAERGVKGGRTKPEKTTDPPKSNDLAEAPAKPTETETYNSSLRSELSETEAASSLRSEGDAIASPTPARKQRLQSTIEPDATLDASGLAYAFDHGFVGEAAAALFEQFRDHHQARGTTMADWGAAWRTWVRNEVKFNRGRINGDGTHQHRQPRGFRSGSALDGIASQIGRRADG